MDAGGGDSFRELYRTMAPTVLARILGDVGDPIHAFRVVRATFCEVWLMTANLDNGNGEWPKWIDDIATRRAKDRRNTLDFIAHEPVGSDVAIFWTGLLANQDISTEAALDGFLHDHS